MAARNWIKRLGVLAVMAGLCGIGGLGGYVWSQTVVQKQMNARLNVSGNPQIQVPVMQNYSANAGQINPPNMGMMGGMSQVPQQVFVPSPLGGMMTIPAGPGPWVGGSGVNWEKPKGEEPEWLTRGKQAIQAEDQVRKSLRQELDITLADAQLGTALEKMLRPADIAYTVDSESENQPVTIESRGLVRDGLIRVLRPLGLDYVVRPDGLEIVQVGESHGSVRTYNLAYVVNNSGDMETVTKMVERMVKPNAWQEGGGQGILMGIGSVLVVSTTEMVHEDVEVLLGKLEAMSLQKSPRTSVPANSPGMGGPGLGGAAAPLQTQLYRSGLAPAPGFAQPGGEAPGGFGFTPGAMPLGGQPAAQSQLILPQSKPEPEGDAPGGSGLERTGPDSPREELPGGEGEPSGG